MTAVLVTAAAKLPVGLGEIKAHAVISHDQDDALLQGWLNTAILEAQEETGRQLIASTWDEYFDAWPCEVDSRGELAFVLRWAPLRSVASVKYLDTAGALQTLDAANYRADTVSMRGRVVIKPTASLPSLADQSQGIVIRYAAGYGEEAHDVPEPIRDWIKLQVVSRDKYRELFEDRSPGELPRTFGDGLLDFYRIPKVAA